MRWFYDVGDKVAIKPIEKGADVLKYGERIGRSTCAIEVGQLVDHNNIYDLYNPYFWSMTNKIDRDFKNVLCLSLTLI